jgi:chemotaxis protein CheX
VAGPAPVNSPETIFNAVICALQDVFATMFQEHADLVSYNEIKDTPRVSSIIGFNGPQTGFISLHFSSDMACQLASGLLGMPVEEVDEIVQDAIAELVNMVAGGLRNRLSSSQEDFRLSLPWVVAGLEYSTQGPSGSQELLMGVATERYRFKIQLVLEKHKS